MLVPSAMNALRTRRSVTRAPRELPARFGAGSDGSDRRRAAENPSIGTDHLSGNHCAGAGQMVRAPRDIRRYATANGPRTRDAAHHATPFHVKRMWPTLRLRAFGATVSSDRSRGNRKGSAPDGDSGGRARVSPIRSKLPLARPGAADASPAQAARARPVTRLHLVAHPCQAGCEVRRRSAVSQKHVLPRVRPARPKARLAGRITTE